MDDIPEPQCEGSYIDLDWEGFLFDWEGTLDDPKRPLDWICPVCGAELQPD